MMHESDPHWDDWYEPEIEEHDQLRPRDPMVDKAKEVLKTYFEKNNEWVFYKRQLEVLFEKEFFHWITDRALTELAAEGYIAADTEVVPVVGHLTFFRAKGHRYWKRQAEEIKNLVVRFSDPAFTAALGAQGEQCSTLHCRVLDFCRRDQRLDRTKGKHGLKQGTIWIACLCGME